MKTEDLPTRCVAFEELGRRPCAIIVAAAWLLCGISSALAQDPLSTSDTQADPVFNILNYGAVGDGKTLTTDAFSQAISACTASGGGTVFVPPGIYMNGPIRLQSNMTLFLEAGAMIKASPRLEDYPVEDDGTWGQGSGESVLAGLITAREATCVAIIGRGTIDGNAMAFHDPDKLHGHVDKQYTRQGDEYMDPKFGTQHGPIAHGQRPGNLVRFFDCKNVLLRSVTVQNSPTWTVQFNGCEKVNVTGVNINSHESKRRIPNDDGIDVFNSRNVRISDCDIQTNVHLKLKDSALQPAYGGNFDLRAAKEPTRRVFSHDIPAMYCRYAKGLRIKVLRVGWDDVMPDFFSHALQLEDVDDVVIEGFEGRQPHTTGETIALDRVEGISIRSSKAVEGSDVFLRHEDVTSFRLFTNNDLCDAESAFQPPDTTFRMTGNLLPDK